MKNKDRNNFETLTGKTRDDVRKELGDGFNYYHNNVWTYNLRKDWIGRWVILYIYFKDNEVTHIKIGR
ncbi:MAG: hypothetical protein E2590_03705 [Chryseobacterium sp.]|nr:hypothetical protein [Chryseobacterium sp.]